MVEVTRKFEFAAAHRYWREDWTAEENARVFGKTANAHGHGHNYTLEVSVRGQPDAVTGMVINVTDLKRIVNGVLEEFDHRNLNLDTPYFQDILPTTEAIARVLWRLITPHLPPEAQLARVRLYEMPDLWAEYDGSDEAEFARAYHFSAAHRLHSGELTDAENRELYGKCNNPNGHGHNYTVEVTVRGPLSERNGMVADMVTLDQQVQTVLEPLDFHHLDQEVAGFANRVSTAENIIVYLWEELAPRLDGQLHKLKLWETNNNTFEYRGPGR